MTDVLIRIAVLCTCGFVVRHFFNRFVAAIDRNERPGFRNLSDLVGLKISVLVTASYITLILKGGL